jgi:hypothetical protein
MGFQEEENLNAGDDLIIQIDKENTPPEHADQKLETERTSLYLLTIVRFKSLVMNSY